MLIGIIRSVAALWAGFWLWFGVAAALHERLPWQGVAWYAARSWAACC